MQTLPPQSASVLTPAGYQSGSCGYCKDPTTRKRSPDSSASYYAVAKSLGVNDYQALVDRGWRRSGTTLYKQDLRRSCCPHYTIRLPVADFSPSKDQRQALNKWNRFVLGDDYAREAARLYPKTKAQKAQERHGFNLAQAVHEAEYDGLKRPPEPAHRFEVTLEPDTFSEEKYSLFENYQRIVHHEGPSDISRKGFRRFLCDSPLERKIEVHEDRQQKLGSYHQCYRLDGQLVAMAVLDLLPQCVSGVYFVYHESVSKWSFGKLSALREATLALEGAYANYYMGFYIHSCIKMRYKGDYKPQQILDPESLEWHPLEGQMRQLLDLKKYVSLSREKKNSAGGAGSGEQGLGMSEAQTAYKSAKEAADAVYLGVSLFEVDMPGVPSLEEFVSQVDLNSIKLDLGRVVRLGDLLALNPGSLTDPNSLQGIVAELAACVGPQVSRDMAVNMG